MSRHMPLQQTGRRLDPIMKYFRLFTSAAACVALLGFSTVASAQGSWGGSSGGSVAASSGGGSSGGGHMGLFARLKARHAASASSGGSAGTYTSSYASSGSSGGGVGGSSGGASSGGGGHVGPLRRLMAKIHARKAASGSHGGSSGGVTYASYSGGSSGGSSVSYGGSGSSGGHASYGGYSDGGVQSISMGATSMYESPIIESSYESYTPMGETIIDGGYPMGETNLDSVPIEGSSLQGGSLGTETNIDAVRYESTKPAIEADAAMLTVAVPTNAVVTVNGHPTTSDGNVRQFMSRGLKEGFVYTYVVDVTYEVGGTEKKDSKSVKLRPGDEETVEFAIPAEPKSVEDDLVEAAQDVITVVKLHVPADAEVSLAGNLTNGQGAIRTFRTKQLKPGQQWAGYTVRVTTSIDGQPVTKEHTVDVQAGSTTELTFDFANNVVASR